MLHDGKVGIGTTDPGYRFEVKESSATWISRIYNTGTGNGLLVRVDSASSDAIFSTHNGTNHLLVVKGNGKVGIGTYTPGIFTGFSNAGNYLTIYDTVAATLELARGSNNNNYAVGRVQFVNTNNTDGATADGDSKGIAYISAHVETTDTNAGADSGGYLRFATKLEAESPAEQMRIQGDGNVGINTLLPEHKLHVAGDAIISGVLYDSTNSSGDLRSCFDKRSGRSPMEDD